MSHRKDRSGTEPLIGSHASAENKLLALLLEEPPGTKLLAITRRQPLTSAFDDELEARLSLRLGQE